MSKVTNPWCPRTTRSRCHRLVAQLFTYVLSFPSPLSASEQRARGEHRGGKMVSSSHRCESESFDRLFPSQGNADKLIGGASSLLPLLPAELTADRVPRPL